MSEQIKEVEREEVVVAPTSQPAPQPTNGRQARRSSGGGGIAFAAVLIVLGGALLLDNMNLVSINWFGLLRYWPVTLDRGRYRDCCWAAARCLAACWARCSHWASWQVSYGSWVCKKWA